MWIVHAYRDFDGNRVAGDGWFYGPFETKEAAEAFCERRGPEFTETAIVTLGIAD